MVGMVGMVGPGGGVCWAFTALETSSNHLSASDGVRLWPLCICIATETGGGEWRGASVCTHEEVACIGAGGGGRTGGTVQVGGPFVDIDGLEKSSSDGLVNEVLIWLHRAFILLSPSPGNPISISGFLVSKSVLRCSVDGRSLRRSDSCLLKGEFFWLRAGNPRNEP